MYTAAGLPNCPSTCRGWLAYWFIGSLPFFVRLFGGGVSTEEEAGEDACAIAGARVAICGNNLELKSEMKFSTSSALPSRP